VFEEEIMKWTEQKRKKLLSCVSDAELLKAFPKRKIDSLRRTQRMFRNGEQAEKGSKSIEKTIILPDFHHPHHNKSAWRAILKFIKWWKPDRVVLLGDAMNMDAIDHWKRDKGDLKHFEGKRLKYDYGLFDIDILTPIEKLVPDAEKIYMGGNHEDWVNIVVNQSPQLEEMVEPEIFLELGKRGWQWIPYIHTDRHGNCQRGTLQIGKLMLFHGHYINIYHARKTADSYSMSCAYGHTHDVQLHTKVTVDNPRGYHTAQSIGCLCKTAPDFMRGRMNRWVNAFGALYTRPSGHYNLYVPIIINGTFTFEGKHFTS